MTYRVMVDGVEVHVSTPREAYALAKEMANRKQRPLLDDALKAAWPKALWYDPAKGTLSPERPGDEPPAESEEERNEKLLEFVKEQYERDMAAFAEAVAEGRTHRVTVEEARAALADDEEEPDPVVFLEATPPAVISEEPVRKRSGEARRSEDEIALGRKIARGSQYTVAEDTLQDHKQRLMVCWECGDKAQAAGERGLGKWGKPEGRACVRCGALVDEGCVLRGGK